MIFVLGWITIVLSTIALVLNINKDKYCFVIWGIMNLLWAALDASYGFYFHSILFLIYAALSIYGFIMWSIKNDK